MKPAWTLAGTTGFFLGIVAGILFMATLLFITGTNMQFLHADWVLPAAISFIAGGIVGVFTMVLPVLLATDGSAESEPAIGAESMVGHVTEPVCHMTVNVRDAVGESRV